MNHNLLTRRIRNKKYLTTNTNTTSNKAKATRKNKRTYSNDDYKSGDGMLVTVWGPSLWHSLHTISFNYPAKPSKQEKHSYRNFILSLQHVLPCKYCRINLKNNFKQMPLTMEDMECRESFSRYIYELHELINKMLKKKSGLSYDDVRERYEHFRARCSAENSKLFKFKPMDSKTKKHKKGCTEPLYGKKSKCVIKIVPQEEKCDTFQMDKKCIKKRVSQDETSESTDESTDSFKGNNNL